jgi:hypothetical protein
MEAKHLIVQKLGAGTEVRADGACQDRRLQRATVEKIQMTRVSSPSAPDVQNIAELCGSLQQTQKRTYIDLLRRFVENDVSDALFLTPWPLKEGGIPIAPKSPLPIRAGEYIDAGRPKEPL